ncbi:MAG: hypothetical protein RJA34_2925 [Pseudomonadota bacterium]|jgi:type I restriction enzyme R subunit
MSHIHHECELERHIVEQLAASGWQVGAPGQYDKLRALNGANAKSTVLDPLAKALDASTGTGSAVAASPCAWAALRLVSANRAIKFDGRRRKMKKTMAGYEVGRDFQKPT